MQYKPRTLDQLVEHSLQFAGAVLIEGVQACGKTTTGLHHSRSSIRLDTDPAASLLAEIDPGVLLEGETPRLVDEWQREPRLWNHMRQQVDQRQQAGQFVLTGSATPADDTTRHSGAGRVLRMRMRPMSLYESEHSSAVASLQQLVEGHSISTGKSGLDLHGMIDRLCIGGRQAMQSLTPQDAGHLLRSYLDDISRVDLLATDGLPARDPLLIRRVLAAYARHVSTPASQNTIARDTATDDPLHRQTVARYLETLQRIMVIEEQPSWGPHLRSKDLVRKGTMRHFVDSSLAVAALGTGPEQLLKDPQPLGLLFESLAVRDLRIYAQLLDGEVFHYRDSAGAEADMIVQLRDSRWLAVEVKLSPAQIDAAAKSLHRFVAKVDTSKTGEPAALIVITAGEYAYTRPDGVHVVPLGALAP